jgi:hypothetical protein
VEILPSVRNMADDLIGPYGERLCYTLSVLFSLHNSGREACNKGNRPGKEH